MLNVNRALNHYIRTGIDYTKFPDQGQLNKISEDIAANIIGKFMKEEDSFSRGVEKITEYCETAPAEVMSSLTKIKEAFLQNQLFIKMTKASQADLAEIQAQKQINELLEHTELEYPHLQDLKRAYTESPQHQLDLMKSIDNPVQKMYSSMQELRTAIKKECKNNPVTKQFIIGLKNIIKRDPDAAPAVKLMDEAVTDIGNQMYAPNGSFAEIKGYQECIEPARALVTEKLNTPASQHVENFLNYITR